MGYECEAYFSIDIDTRGEIQRELLLISEFIFIQTKSTIVAQNSVAVLALCPVHLHWMVTDHVKLHWNKQWHKYLQAYN